MQFLVIAYDGTDSEAPARRAKVRQQHLDGVKKLAKEGKAVFGAALIGEDGSMIGSSMVMEYDSKEELLEDWFNQEPYVMGEVWKDVTIKPCKVSDFFLDKSLL